MLSKHLKCIHNSMVLTLLTISNATFTTARLTAVNTFSRSLKEDALVLNSRLLRS